MKALWRTRILRLFIMAVVLIVLTGLFIELRRMQPWFLFDYIQYWSASSLLLNNQNPYDPSAMLAVQQTIGWLDPNPQILYLPPWSLPFFLPISLIEYESSRTLWVFFQISTLVVSAFILWKLYAGDRFSGRAITIITSLLTFSTFFVLFFGQLSFLVVLGIAGFMAMIRRNSSKTDFFAGCITLLIAIKPQVFYLFWPALVIWTLSTRRWYALIGTLFGFLSSMILGSILYPNLIPGYLASFQVIKIQPLDWFTPTVGSWLSLYMGDEYSWLRFITVVLGLTWVVFYSWKKRARWDWAHEMPLLILVSLSTTAHTWTHDQILLMVPFIQIAGSSLLALRPNLMKLIIGVSIVSNIALLTSRFFIRDHYFVWLAPLMLALYLLGRRFIFGEPPPPISQQNSPSLMNNGRFDS